VMTNTSRWAGTLGPSGRIGDTHVWWKAASHQYSPRVSSSHGLPYLRP
jgi:hypothetical protein